MNNVNQRAAHTSDHLQRSSGHTSAMASRSQSFDRRSRVEVDSWVEIASQPSSSSLSSIGDDIVTTGLRVQGEQRSRRRRAQRPGAPTHLHVTRTQSAGGTSSQEEYEESESESDRIMTSSNEGPVASPGAVHAGRTAGGTSTQTTAPEDGIVQSSDDDDDENRTAVNDPINTENCFTPLPNAFSHPPTGRRTSSQQAPGSYFPATRPGPCRRPSTRHSYPTGTDTRRLSHAAQNPLSPSFNATVEHDEALKASLQSLLSVAAAARGINKVDAKQPASMNTAPRSNRIDPTTFRLVPESALQSTPSPQREEPTFKPTIRRSSTQSTETTSDRKEGKRKTLSGRSSSRERRSLKKAKRSESREDLHVTPTLLTWVVSAGVVVFISALSFSAGYRVGKEAGHLEASTFAADEQLRSCAREAGRSSLGLKRSLARSAIQV
ncbi:hypothetical protein CERZMDRAFT_116810 [Cercospora zeae-maydis SCOH1-5]|uniref:Transmembrane protein n=1 Tax=Cercospora zeae-maydis SCOH1-5 TaxID=717836 RepID=A0A6A6FMF0_9PEZI|nr:hypothetical protein CERZMDRAFT_116810 [Cercospora zeae-maydis SCOH1-5]